MNIIKVNYNNAAVKKAKELIPVCFCYRYSRLGNDGVENVFCIEVDARINEESFYVNFLFEVYVNEILVGYINKDTEENEAGRYVIELVNNEQVDMNQDKILVQIKGTYVNEFGNEYSFIKDMISVYNYFTVNEELFCDENIFCNDCLYAYLHEGSFYVDIEGIPGEYTYDGEIDPTSFDGVFVDIHTNLSYEWDSNSNEYKLLY